MAVITHVLPVTSFQQNCSILICEQTGAAAIVDPGGEPLRLQEFLRSLEVFPVTILLTHAHVDHAGAAAVLAERLRLPIHGPHIGDRFLVRSLRLQGILLSIPSARSFRPTRWLRHEDTVRFGKVELQVLHCPGHTPGHVVFFDADSRLAFVGDVVFREGIGRSDLPGGRRRILLRSIHERLLPLGDDVRFVAGHGPMSTLGWERNHNPFL